MDWLRLTLSIQTKIAILKIMYITSRAMTRVSKTWTCLEKVITSNYKELQFEIVHSTQIRD